MLQIRIPRSIISLCCGLLCAWGQEAAAQQSAVEEVRRELPPSSAVEEMVISVDACPVPWAPVAPPAGSMVALTARGPEGPLQWTAALTLTFREDNVVASESEIVSDSILADLSRSGEALLLGLLPVRLDLPDGLITYEWTLPEADEPRDVAAALLSLDRGEALSLDVSMSLDLEGLNVTHRTSGSVELLGCGEVVVGGETHSVRAFETNLPTSAVNAGGKARVFYLRRRVYVSDSLAWPIVIDEGSNFYSVVTEIN